VREVAPGVRLMGMSRHEIATVLDTAMAAFTIGRADIALPVASAGLNLARKAMPDADWREAIHQAVAPHPLREAVLADPMTRRAVEKPRGYAGDAVLLDYVYRLRPGDLENATPEATRVNRFIVDGPAARGVRHRLGVLAAAIERVGARAAGPGSVMALACGHLRELASVPEASWPRNIVALDQDAESLAVVSATYRDPRVQPRRGTVRDVLARRIGGEPFDLVYAAGLFDYLDRPVASVLVSRLFERVAPGGTLLIANFTPDTPDIGFMEALMEWHLIYRTEADMWSLLDGVAPQAGARTWRDPDGCIVYLEVQRPKRRDAV
jgi:extracellular factor (EF) 3-hydroxypalmitic acid methyl ester biosynthesis protein